MPKRNLFLLVLAGMLIAAAGFPHAAAAAEVTKVNRSRGHVYIDQGKNAGFVFGAEVCFYSESGEKVTCGVVRQASESYAMVKVNNRASKAVKRGDKARLSAEGAGTPESK